MPKLLSRSNHEELESNSALQIKNQEERIAENKGNWSTYEIGSCEHCSFLLPIPAVTCFCCFAFVFGFSPF